MHRMLSGLANEIARGVISEITEDERIGRQVLDSAGMSKPPRQKRRADLLLRELSKEIARNMGRREEPPSSEPLADEIAARVISQLGGRIPRGRGGKEDENNRDGLLEVLLRKLSNEVSEQLGEALREDTEDSEEQSGENLLVGGDEGVRSQERLAKAEEKLEKMGIKWSGEDEDEDEDEIKGTGARYPNLKYAKPKYRNLESVLKYTDGNPVQGLKLVIMNFND